MTYWRRQRVAVIRYLSLTVLIKRHGPTRVPMGPALPACAPSARRPARVGGAFVTGYIGNSGRWCASDVAARRRPATESPTECVRRRT
jgi:hypothetical protein